MALDRELLELAAKAVGIRLYVWGTPGSENFADMDKVPYGCLWNPLTDDGDRLRLARQLGINIDFADCCAWKRMASGNLHQEFWGGDCMDEAHAIVSIAAEIGRAQ